MADCTTDVAPMSVDRVIEALHAGIDELAPERGTIPVRLHEVGKFGASKAVILAIVRDQETRSTQVSVATVARVRGRTNNSTGRLLRELSDEDGALNRRHQIGTDYFVTVGETR